MRKWLWPLRFEFGRIDYGLPWGIIGMWRGLMLDKNMLDEYALRHSPDVLWRAQLLVNSLHEKENPKYHRKGW